MSLATACLPHLDPDALRAFALACQAELKAAELSVQLRTLEIEKLKFQIARLRRMQFGRSSERITRQIAQLELQLEELETGEAEDSAHAAAEDRPEPIRPRTKPKRKPLPDHLPRQEIVHQPEADGACTCPDCGAGMAKLGEDVTEVLDYVPGHFQVIRHVHAYACKACDAITQAPAAAMPTPRGRATPATLAHVLVSKYCDHLPLYRQSEIYARAGVDLDRSTLCDWVGPSGLAAAADRRWDQTARVRGRERPWRRHDGAGALARSRSGPRRDGSGFMFVTTDRSAARIRRRLPATSVLTAAASIRRGTSRTSQTSCRPMAMPASRRLYDRRVADEGYRANAGITEVACWAHCRRKFFDVWDAQKSPVAKQAIDRIAAFYVPEAKARFAPAAERLVHRAETAPRLASFFDCAGKVVTRLSAKSELAGDSAIPSSGESHCHASSPTRGSRSTTTLLRTRCGRKNYLFAGPAAPGRTAVAGERAAAVYHPADREAQ